MIYTVDKILRDVRIALGENFRRNELLVEEDRDTVELDEQIAARIEPAAQAVMAQAPLGLLGPGRALADTTIRRGSDGTAWIYLPKDFMRLVTLRLSGWATALHEVITPEHPAYAMQRSRFAGIRGNFRQPVAALVHRGASPALEIYGADKCAVIDDGRYVPYPRLDRHGGLEFPPPLYDELIALITATFKPSTTQPQP